MNSAVKVKAGRWQVQGVERRMSDNTPPEESHCIFDEMWDGVLATMSLLGGGRDFFMRKDVEAIA